MDIKELNSNSYNVNSKYKKHKGIGIKKYQKSRSYHEDKLIKK